MKGVYGRFYSMTRNETTAVIAITVAVVVAYSVWGAYLLHSGSDTSPQVVSAGR
jgi:hypothetical protein